MSCRDLQADAPSPATKKAAYMLLVICRKGKLLLHAGVSVIFEMYEAFSHVLARNEGKEWQQHPAECRVVGTGSMLDNSHRKRRESK